MTHSKSAEELKAWLVQQALRGVSRGEMLQAFCTELSHFGVPLLRMQLVQRALHPEFGGIGFTWTRTDGLRTEHYGRPDQAQEVWRASPFYAVIDRAAPEMSVDLYGPEADRFAVFDDLRAAGGRYYYLNWQPLGPVERHECDADTLDMEGVLVSWTLDGPDAAEPAHRALIRDCIETLTIVLAAAGNRAMGRDLLKVYLGRDAGERVMSGEIRRGDSQLIDAVICLFDLRGFTRMAEELPGTQVVDMLNDYFGHVVEIIHAHEGNILKFMGDGLMAMFNLGTLEADTQAALRAVAALEPSMEQLNADRLAHGLPVTDYTLALHAGEILYGNIGADSRLDFTVIGPTVNLTARIADMHRTVERQIILSQDVRNAAGAQAPDLVSLGRYMLRGVAEPIELFTIYTPKAS